MVEDNRHPHGADAQPPGPTTPGSTQPPDTGDVHPPPGGLLHASIRTEKSDASFGWVLGLIIGAMCFVALVQWAILRFYNDYEAYQAKIKASRYPLATTPSTGLPPEPRLEQVNRMAEIESPNVFLREASKESVLRGYGATQEKGYVHIPIDRAMDYLADKLPAREEQPAAEQRKRQDGLVDYGASNSGRMFRGKTP
jgi:hypothetical protein